MPIIKQSRRELLGWGAAAMAGGTIGWSTVSAKPPSRLGTTIVLRNARLFDGENTTLREGLQVFVRDAKILAVEPAAVAPPANAAVIDCRRQMLMPGLIDAHYHTMFAALPPELRRSATLDTLALYGAQDMEAALMRGYTTLRDVGSASFGLKDAIDRGGIAGPRIFPSGLALSQTGGHGEMREPSEVPGYGNDLPEISNYKSVIADGADAVRRRVREQLLMGASQIKVMAGGGIISPRDPLDSLQYSTDEIKAAVDTAADWGTYVTVHAYTPQSIERSIRAGVKCVEHGQLADENAAKMMRDHGIWWSIQPFVPLGKTELTDPRQIQKLESVVQGTDTAYHLAKRFGIRVGYGTDYAFNPEGAARQSTRLAALGRWYDPVAALRIATGENAALLALSARRNPYPDGALGVIKPGAYADLLVVDFAAAQSLERFLEPETTLRLIMKDGRIFKNALDA